MSPHPLQIDFSEDSIEGIDCPAFGVGNREIVDLVWPALLDAPESRLLEQWVSRRLRVPVVAPELVMNFRTDVSMTLDSVATAVTQLSDTSAAEFVSRLGLDYGALFEEAEYSDRLLLIAASFMHRDGLLVFSTAGCDPTGVVRVIERLRSSMSEQCALHLSFPVLDEDDPLLPLVDRRVEAKLVTPNLWTWLSKLIRPHP